MASRHVRTAQNPPQNLGRQPPAHPETQGQDVNALNGGIQLLTGIAVIAAAFTAAYMWDHGLIDNDPELCPMGCGRTTNSHNGGPCHDCWNQTERTQP